MINYIFTLNIVWIFIFSFILIYFFIKQKNDKPFNILNHNFLNNFLNFLPIILFSIIIFVIALKLNTKIKNIYEISFNLQIFLVSINYLLLIILYKGYSDLGKNWRYNYGNSEKFTLITDKIFSRTRNPIFIFYNFSALIWFLLTGNILILACLCGIIVTLHRKILLEEEFLSKVFGKKYLLYKKKVRRYF